MKYTSWIIPVVEKIGYLIPLLKPTPQIPNSLPEGSPKFCPLVAVIPLPQH